jgi:hypothetical protein
MYPRQFKVPPIPISESPTTKTLLDITQKVSHPDPPGCLNKGVCSKITIPIMDLLSTGWWEEGVEAWLKLRVFPEVGCGKDRERVEAWHC